MLWLKIFIINTLMLGHRKCVVTWEDIYYSVKFITWYYNPILVKKMNAYLKRDKFYTHTHTQRHGIHSWFLLLEIFLKVELKGKNILLSYCTTLSLSYNKHNSLHGKCLRNKT